MSKQRTRHMVSPEMVELRNTLSMLNRFLWTTELSYGYVLTDPAGDFKIGHRKAREVLGRVTATQAWYPTRQGKIRFNETVTSFLMQVEGNTGFIYRAVIVFFMSSFQEYLEKRVGKHRVRTRGSGWGPYLVSLSGSCGVASSGAVHLQTLLCADFCREIRNLIAHEPAAVLPQSVDDKKITDWTEPLRSKSAALADQLTPDLVKDAAKHFYEEAVNNTRRARKQGRELPIEFFYMLFTLANLDKLALEIEDALPAASEMVPLEQQPRRVFNDRTGGKGPILA